MCLVDMSILPTHILMPQVYVKAHLSCDVFFFLYQPLHRVPPEQGKNVLLICPTRHNLFRMLGLTTWQNLLCSASPRATLALPRTVWLGYAFNLNWTTPSPKYSVVLYTSVQGESTTVLLAEIAVLLKKDVIKPVPPAKMKKGFYSPYIIVPKKRWGAATNLRPVSSELGPALALVQ